MADKEWRGDALDRAHKRTITVGGTWVTNDTVTCTINGKDLVLTVGATVTTAAIATAIKEMWNGDTITGDATRSETGNNVAEFNEITASVSGSVVTLTNDTDGVPFTNTTTKSSAAGTVTDATSQEAKGPALFDDADNWAITNAVPVDNDAAYFANVPSSRPLKYNLSQTGIGLTTIDILFSMEADIGLPRENTNGYFEYREDYWTLGDAAIATAINVGKGAGLGSGRIKIDHTAGQAALTVWNTGTPAENGIEALLFKGTHASNVVNVRRGSVGIAVLPGETAVVATLRVGHQAGEASDARVRCGSSVTLTDVTQTGGRNELNAGISGSYTLTGGEAHVNAGNVPTLVIRDATFFYNGTGTLGGTSLKVQEGGVLDLTRGQGTCTCSNFNLYAGATVRAPKGRFASNPVFRLNGCLITEVTIEVEDDFDVDHI